MTVSLFEGHCVWACMAGFHGDCGINNQPQGLAGLMGRVNKRLNEVKHSRAVFVLLFTFPRSGPALLSVLLICSAILYRRHSLSDLHGSPSLIVPLCLRIETTLMLLIRLGLKFTSVITDLIFPDNCCWAITCIFTAGIVKEDRPWSGSVCSVG